MVKMPHWPMYYSSNYKDTGLRYLKELLKLLDNPHHNLPPVIHVTGTNGKGSTIAYLKYIFESAGYKIHRYISPHLIEFNERIMLAGQQISDEDLFFFVEKCREVVLAHPEANCTFFETTTAIAMLAFASVKADVLLLEVGMGGAKDATNVIPKTELSIITSISYDHMEVLGDHLLDIAEEKSGIIKENTPCVISWQNEDVMYKLIEKCIAVNAPYFVCGEQWIFEVKDEGFYVELNPEKCPTIIEKFNKTVFGPFKPGLFGVHQTLNASTAVVSALIMSTLKYPKIGEKEIVHGITHAKWPARLERITNGKLADLLPSKDWEIWLDGAHNVSGAAMMGATFANMEVKKPFYIINGRTEKRDIWGFLECFKQTNPEIICCVKVETEHKPEYPDKIKIVADELGFKAKIFESLQDAIQHCVQDGQNKGTDQIGGRILICGSLYLAGDVLIANRVD